METSVYDVTASVQTTHWWYQGRRRLFARIIESFQLPRTARILDVGSGTGANLEMLAEMGFSNVNGLDFNPLALRLCCEKGLPFVKLGSATTMPFEDCAFDLVIATDVMEHLEDQRKAANEISRVLKSGGRALVTVPAFRSLWGPQDVLSHHFRRYRKVEVIRIFAAAGLEIHRAFYFNFLLFVPIWLARRLLILSKTELRSEAEINSALLNYLLLMIFQLDTKLAPLLRLPFGVSILLIARKP